MILRRERPQLRRLLERIPDSDGPNAGRKPFQEIIPDRLMDEQTRSRDARLSLVVVRGEQGSLDRGREVRVREHDVRAFPAEFQEGFLQRVGPRSDDVLSDLDGSGEADLRDVRMAGEPRAGHRAFSGDDIDRTRRKARVDGEPRHLEGAHRRVFGRFQDDGIPRREGRGDVPGDEHEGKIPGDDLADDAERLPQRIVQHPFE